VHVARRIDVFHNGALGIDISVSQIEAPGSIDPQIFILKKHEWKRAFTDEMR
jgi:hypothetical protein